MPSSNGSRVGLSVEQEQLLEHDDLDGLLGAINAKRVARGKPLISAADVELRVWALEQEMRRSAGG